MRPARWALILVCIAVFSFFICTHPDSSGGIKNGYAATIPAVQTTATTGHAFGSRAPRYIKVRMKTPIATLVAGETGSFELEAELSASKDAAGLSPAWDWGTEAPLVVWVASPDTSGISFIDRVHPERPRQHILVKFTTPSSAPGSQVLTATVEYSVNARTKAGKHTFWMDIYGELSGANKQKFEDMGVGRLPFEVDTHLKTKLLMLAVVVAAVFLFIMEWVRVDVVAIAMMVLLPELGLLNAQDTFKGISSNAVMAIIGVMIISYGLNRAGLVNRIIQPMLKLVGKSPRRLTVLFSGLIAVISSVMQNTGAAVLFSTRHSGGHLLSPQDSDFPGTHAHRHGGNSRRYPDNDRNEPTDFAQ